MQLSDLIKERVNIPDLATRLNVKLTKKGSTHFFAIRDEKTPSTAISKDGKSFTDFGDNRRGSVIDFYMIQRGCDWNVALKDLAQMYQIERPRDAEEKAKPEINLRWREASQHKDIQRATEYLVTERGLPRDKLVNFEGKAYGFNNYLPTHPSQNPAEYGPAVVFPLSDVNGQVWAINQRYIDTAENKHPLGKRMLKFSDDILLSSCFYTPDWRSVQNAKNIWMVESPIDALTLHLAGCPAVAFLSAGYASICPLEWIKPTQVVHIWSDNDVEKNGKKAGLEAAEILYHRLLSAGIIPQLVDIKWEETDVNGLLKANAGDLKIINKSARTSNTKLFPFKKPNISNKLEFTSLNDYVCYVDSTAVWKYEKQKNELGEMEEVPVLAQVAGFRIYRIDPITIHPPKSAMGEGTHESLSEKMLILYARTESSRLQKAVFDKKDMGKPKMWQELGIIHDPKKLGMLMQSISRDHSHYTETVNVIGLVNMNGQLRLNDALNTYIGNDLSVYHDLVFPNGNPNNTQSIIYNMGKMFKGMKGLTALTWILGSFLKIYTGFWPHMSCVASSQSGKTTLMNVLNTLTNIRSFEYSMLSSQYQQMKIVGNHAYACLIDEISRAKPFDLQEFINQLNACYNSPVRLRGQDRAYLLAGAVGMFGQDLSITDAAIVSKSIAIDLDRSKGDLYEPTEPFPVRAWAEWLIATQNKAKISKLLKEHEAWILLNMDAEEKDPNLTRFVVNYAAMRVAAQLLFDFADIQDVDYKTQFSQILTNQCKQHAIDTRIVRSEAFAILEALVSNVGMESPERFPPHAIEDEKLYITSTEIMKYLHGKKEYFAVTSNKGLIKHLKNDGFLLRSDVDKTLSRGNEKPMRYKHVLEIDLARLEKAGIYWPTPVKPEDNTARY